MAERRADVTIHWPRHSRRIDGIIRTGRCPSRFEPKKARNRAVVALVDDTGRVQLVFRLTAIVKKQAVIGANGRRYLNGCILVAEPGSIHRPRRHDPQHLTVNRHGVGAIGYFDAKKNIGVFYTLTGTMPAAPDDGPRGLVSPRGHALFSDNIGKTLSQPERKLIADYVRWLGPDQAFEHHYLPGPRLYTDLFHRPRWILFEAKVGVAREVLRAAIGQLMDYQRYYVRHPQLALLVAERPPTHMIDLLSSKRVGVVWRSRGRSFNDSVEGALTTALRGFK